MCLAFIISAFSYHLFEEPIRRGRWLKQASNITKFVAFSSLALTVVSISIIATSGAIQRYPQQLRPYLSAFAERGDFRCGKFFSAFQSNMEMCPLHMANTPGGVLILGDSHADVLDEKIAEIAAKTNISAYLTVRNCDLGTFGETKFCSDAIFKKIIRQAKELGIDHIIAISFWQPVKLTSRGLKDELKRLVDSKFKVTIVETVPHDESYHPEARALAALAGAKLKRTGLPRDTVDRIASEKNAIFKDAATGLSDSVEIISPADWLCDANRCLYEQDGTPLYLDTNHLTFAGAALLEPMIEQLLFSRSGR